MVPVVTVHEEVGVFTVHPEDANVSLAPVVGPANLTATPETLLPLASVAVATSGLAKAPPITRDCPEPDVAVSVVAVPAVMETVLELAEVMPPLVALKE